MSSLKTLDISYNKITTVYDEAFVGLNTLKRLYMQNNEVKELSDSVLGTLTNLRTLDLR